MARKKTYTDRQVSAAPQNRVAAPASSSPKMVNHIQVGCDSSQIAAKCDQLENDGYEIKHIIPDHAGSGVKIIGRRK